MLRPMPTDRWLAVLILYQAQFIRHLRYCFYFYIYGILKEVNVFISNSVRDVIVYYLLCDISFLGRDTKRVGHCIKDINKVCTYFLPSNLNLSTFY